MPNRFLATLASTLALICQPSAAQEIPVFSGPLVGHTTDTSATIWTYGPSDAKIELTLTNEDESGEAASLVFVAVPKPAGDLPGVPYKIVLEDLKPLTTYQIAVTSGDKPIGEGTFRTAPVSGEAARFRLAVTSCMKFGQPQGSWNLLGADKPDLHITLGDTQYSDTTNPTVQWRHHLRYRGVKEFAKVISSIPTYAMWDDHDYGPNNSDGTAKGKENSLEGWKQIWGNPESGTADIPGAFYKFRWGDVDFFVLDGRYHRSPGKAADDDKKRMLGDEQFAWLVDGLKNSKAKFKVIASGSTLHDSTADGWRIYTFSRHRFLDAIKENKIDGVLYLSGDIHRSHVRIHQESDRVGYPLVEVVSSGVANSRTLSYATIDFDTMVEDPTMTVRIVHGDGKTHDEKSWKLTELSLASAE